jgi:hypothetical protein
LETKQEEKTTMKFYFGKIWTPVFDGNDIDALIPEVWAQEALMVLEANAVAAGLVYRDFEDEIAQFGDIVNAHRPRKFQAKRKGYDDDVVTQAAVADNIPVPLNQHLYTSFIIKDGEESKSFKSLRDMYLIPALESINQAMDVMVLGQVYNFLDNAVGQLGVALDEDTVVDIETKFNTLHVPPGQRWGLLTPQAKGQASKIDKFTDAHRIGDDGTAIRTGSLGFLYGTNWIMAQNAPFISSEREVYLTALTANEPIGETVLAVTAFAAEHDAHIGGWLTVAGDMTPQKIISVDNAAETITISPGLRDACVSTAVVTVYVPGLIDLSAGYAADWYKEIEIDTVTVAPETGQLMSLDDATTPAAFTSESAYAVMPGATTTLVLPEVPVRVAVENNDIVGLGPSGNYSFCFHPEAIALVTRPLAAPAAGTGALASVASYNGLSIRVVMTYDGIKQGHLVTVDMLCGIKVLNTDLGIPLLS